MVRIMDEEFVFATTQRNIVSVSKSSLANFVNIKEEHFEFIVALNHVDSDPTKFVSTLGEGTQYPDSAVVMGLE